MPGSCGVCRSGGGCVVAHPCAPFCVSIQPNPDSSLSPPPFRLVHLRSPPLPSPSFIVPYRHIDSFSNSISLNGIKTILLRVREHASTRRRNAAERAAVRFSRRRAFRLFLLIYTFTGVSFSSSNRSIILEREQEIVRFCIPLNFTPFLKF